MSAIYPNASVTVKDNTQTIVHFEIQADTIAIAMVFAKSTLDDARVTYPNASVVVEMEDEVIFDSAKYVPITRDQNSHEGAYIGVVCGIVFERYTNFVNGAKNANEKIGFDDTNLNRLIMADFIADHVSAFEYQPSATRIAKFVWWRMDELNQK